MSFRHWDSESKDTGFDSIKKSAVFNFQTDFLENARRQICEKCTNGLSHTLNHCCLM